MPSSPCGEAKQQQVERGKGDRQPRAGRLRLGRIEYVVKSNEPESCIAHRQQNQSKRVPTRNLGLILNVHLGQAGCDGEEDEEAPDKKCCLARLSV